MTILHQNLYRTRELVRCTTEYIKKESINIKKTFWIDVFQKIIKYNEKLVVDNEFILVSPIFYNKNLLIGRKTIYCAKWYKCGVRFINNCVKIMRGFSVSRDV